MTLVIHIIIYVPTINTIPSTLMLLLQFILAEKSPQITHNVYFEVTVGDKPIGTIKLGMFGQTTPKTVENFVAIANGTNE